MGVVNKMKFQAIRRSTTPEMVIGEILKSVKSGQLKPGDKLPPERELTQMFGVGRSSIREAITALALMGYLDVTQGKGAFLKDDIPSGDLSAAQLNEVLAAEGADMGSDLCRSPRRSLL